MRNTSVKALLKKFISAVEIEISSLCNRQCVYCSYKDADRKRELLDLKAFERVTKSLTSVNYASSLAFHQFNEPLLEADHLFACIDLARRNLPKAQLYLFSNGDLLTRELLNKLILKGVNKIELSCHLNPGESWSPELAAGKIAAKCGELGLPCNLNAKPGETSAVIDFEGVNTILLVGSKDYLEHGSDRMGTVKEIKAVRENKECRTLEVSNGTGELRNRAANRTNREKICDFMVHYLNIAYSGTGYICCDCCHGAPGMERYALPSIHDSSIFELYAAKIPFIREYLFGTKPKCCTHCFWG